jgi:hypothetical protein
VSDHWEHWHYYIARPWEKLVKRDMGFAEVVLAVPVPGDQPQLKVIHAPRHVYREPHWINGLNTPWARVGPNTCTHHRKPARSGSRVTTKMTSDSRLAPGFHQVNAFGFDGLYERDEHDEIIEEVSYVTLDLGTVEPTLVPSTSTYRLIVR